MRPGSPGGRDYEKEKITGERFEVRNAFADFRRKRLIPSGPWSRCRIRQAGKYGALLETGVRFEHGDMLELSMRFVAYPEPIRAVAQVVRVTGEKDACKVGVEFLRIRKEDVRKLDRDEYLGSLVRRRDDEIAP